MKQAGKHAGLIAELLNTREGRQFISEAVPEIISLWSGDKRLRKLAARPAARSIKKSFSPGAPGAGSLKELTVDHDFLSRLKKALLSGKVSGSAVTADFLHALGTLPPEELIEWGNLIIKGDRQGEGLMTLTAKIINIVHEKNPRYLANRAEEELKGFFERNDFGEIAEAVCALLDDISSASETGGRILWQYPSKALSLISLIPELVNAVMKILLYQLRPLNDIAPDLLTNVIESILKQIDGETAGSIISEAAELVRKIDTGNALLGEPGKTVLPPLIQEKMKDFIKAFDPDLLIFAMKTWDSVKAELNNQTARRIKEDPSLVQHRASSPFRKADTKIKNAERYLSLLEAFFDRGNNFSSGIMPDPVTAADIVNRGAEVINYTPEETGKAAKEFITQFFASLNGPEISQAAESITSAMTASLRPVASEVLPPVIRGIAELLRPDPDNPSDEMNEALSLLRDVLVEQEVKS